MQVGGLKLHVPVRAIATNALSTNLTIVEEKSNEMDS